jgi:FkbM family methyltransferase
MTRLLIKSINRLFIKSVYTLKNESVTYFLKKVGNKLVFWLTFCYERLTFKPYLITKNIGGVEIKLLIRDLFAKHWYDRPKSIDKWPELVWLKEHCLTEGDIVCDCGANIGFTGIFFAHCVGQQGKVIGFEALPANSQNAEENIKLNSITNYQIRNEAVGSYNGLVEFIDYPNGSVGRAEGMKTIVVPVVKLDDIFNTEKPTFIKIDVEGYEIEVLKGATEILKTKPKLEIEIHCASFLDRVKSVKELLELIPLTEYELFLQLTPLGEVVPHKLSDDTPKLISQYDNVHLFAIPESKN